MVLSFRSRTGLPLNVSDCNLVQLNRDGFVQNVSCKKTVLNIFRAYEVRMKNKNMSFS